MDLVSQQNQSKRIRNPFGFDFTDRYDGKPYTIPGNGDWYTLVGGLADHAISHLSSKIFNQYHDEQVALLRSQGQSDEAMKFSPSVKVENMIYKMITGEDMPTLSEEQIKIETANLEELNSELRKVTASAATSGRPNINVSAMIDQANAEAVQGKESGTFVAPEAPAVVTTAPIDVTVTPVDVPDAPEQPADTQATDQPAEGFAGLQQPEQPQA